MDIQFKNLNKAYKPDAYVIENLNLTISGGSFTIFVGPSGCGKTTLLRILAGLEEVTAGQVFIGGEEVTYKKPEYRDIAMVFQNYALYPHMTVEANIDFGLKNRKIPAAERTRLIKEVIQLVGLEGYEKTKPGDMSGGQRQRVALARAISKHPQVFLMDEPLSNLDAKLRSQMRSELILLHQKLATTFVYVTHDQVEAMTMGDNIVIMDSGKIMQTGAPTDVYNDPKNIFVAQFIGSPGMNIIELDKYFLGFRPSNTIFTMERPEGQNVVLGGKIVTRELLGSEAIYNVYTQWGLIKVKCEGEIFKIGAKVFCHIAQKHLYFFDCEKNRMYDIPDIADVNRKVAERYG